MQGVPKDEGLIPRSTREVFRLVQKRYPTAKVSMSYLEIYKEVVYDLLSPKETVRGKECLKKKNDLLIKLSKGKRTCGA